MDFKATFPFESARQQQLDILDYIGANWDRYKYFIISAPAGVGKSGIAMAISKTVGDSYLLTSTKILQDQYLSEFEGIHDLRGKDNYDCNINPAFRVSAAPCLAIKTLKKQCMDRNFCSYYKSRDDAINGPCMATSYAYFLPAVECGPLSKPDIMITKYGKGPKRKVMICDEAHELEEKLVEFASVTLKPKYLREHFELKVDPAIRFNDDKKDNTEKAKEFHNLVRIRLSEMNELIEETIERANEWAANDPKNVSTAAAQQIRDLVNKRDVLDRMNKRLNIFFAYPGDPWIVESQEEGTSLRITPVLARRTFGEFVDGYADKIVFMSASMGSKDQVVYELGLDKDQVCFIETGTPFDPAKSPIKIVPYLSMNYKEIDSSIPYAIELVSAILEDHKDEKGIIHSGNYKVCKAILERSSPTVKDRLIGKTEGGGNSRFTMSNEQLVETHRNTDRPTVLVSPSMHTGVDLKDDLSRFQIIVKLPWPNLTDPRVSAKKDMAKSDWYTNEMVKKLIQASGRSTRSCDDYSTTYILDRSFEKTWKWSSYLFPKWFKDRVVWM